MPRLTSVLLEEVLAGAEPPVVRGSEILGCKVFRLSQVLADDRSEFPLPVCLTDSTGLELLSGNCAAPEFGLKMGSVSSAIKGVWNEKRGGCSESALNSSLLAEALAQVSSFQRDWRGLGCFFAAAIF